MHQPLQQQTRSPRDQPRRGNAPARDLGRKARLSGARRNTSPSIVLGSMMSLKFDSLQKLKMGVGGSISFPSGASGSSPVAHAQHRFKWREVVMKMAFGAFAQSLGGMQ